MEFRKIGEYTTSTGRKIQNYKVKNSSEIEKYVPIRYSKIKRRLHYKGFVPWLSELFEKLRLPNKLFENSAIVEINGESYTIFQHQKNKLWFYFSDKFKARNFKRFFSRLKSFFAEKIGNEVKKVFEELEKVMFDELGDLVEYQKKESSSNVYDFKMRNDGEVYINFFGIFKLSFYPFKSNGFSVTVNLELYREHEKRILNVIKKMIEKIGNFLSGWYYTNFGVTVREMPGWMVSPL